MPRPAIPALLRAVHTTIIDKERLAPRPAASMLNQARLAGRGQPDLGRVCPKLRPGALQNIRGRQRVCMMTGDDHVARRFLP